MADNTEIEWTDATWNPITGCSVVSPGCTNCYAMKLAGTRLKHIPSRAGLTRDSKAGPVWTGEVRFNHEWLDQPLRWRRPRMIFVCAHGDLFAEGVPDAWIDQVFAVMSQAPQHTFQVLTKRPERMREYLTRSQLGHQLVAALIQFAFSVPEPGRWPHMPLPNVWLGVSVEDQKRANGRIPVLLDTPAAIRWISAEPLLGSLDVAWALSLNPLDIAAGLLARGHFAPGLEKIRHLDWVVVGGESGHAARPMQPEWAESLRDQCAAAGVPFLFKQWGSHKQTSDCNGRYMIPATKKEAGRLLDGIEHNGFPEVRR
ncbi:protein gp37 [Rhizobium azooxidifex]|uniref:Protein gp37 n=1 Tax=Mycoplana azooxidifex TaxID=1636188 RepID=A0A7W6GL79_9HYPH|nr:phage Gp37/Gp68 family protein [Mycoplana azooxidifex]MBB3979097.1 protein gp37 [Mycoplana azooxidifex]